MNTDEIIFCPIELGRVGITELFGETNYNRLIGALSPELKREPCYFSAFQEGLLSNINGNRELLSMVQAGGDAAAKVFLASIRAAKFGWVLRDHANILPIRGRCFLIADFRGILALWRDQLGHFVYIPHLVHKNDKLRFEIASCLEEDHLSYLLESGSHRPGPIRGGIVAWTEPNGKCHAHFMHLNELEWRLDSEMYKLVRQSRGPSQRVPELESDPYMEILILDAAASKKISPILEDAFQWESEAGSRDIAHQL